MDSGKKIDKPSIFPALLAPPPGIPVPSVEEIKDEALSILAAAADTTGNAMTVSAYNVVNNPEIYKRLCEELKAAFPNAEDTLDYATLEKLPYLVRVISLMLMVRILIVQIYRLVLSKKGFGTSSLSGTLKSL